MAPHPVQTEAGFGALWQQNLPEAAPLATFRCHRTARSPHVQQKTVRSAPRSTPAVPSVPPKKLSPWIETELTAPLANSDPPPLPGSGNGLGPSGPAMPIVIISTRKPKPKSW